MAIDLKSILSFLLWFDGCDCDRDEIWSEVWVSFISHFIVLLVAAEWHVFPPAVVQLESHYNSQLLLVHGKRLLPQLRCKYKSSLRREKKAKIEELSFPATSL